MKASELRIGNLVNYIGLCNSRFNKIGAFQIEKRHLGYLFELEDAFDLLEPITLTELWLKKLGFNKGINDSDMRIQVTKNCSMSVWTCDKEDNCLIGDELILTINYVHELQNLFFDLTKKELTT